MSTTSKRLKLHTFQLGTQPKRGEGIRINTARSPKRGVTLNRLRRLGKFDSWLPSLAPSLALRARFRGKVADDPAAMKRFVAAYDREMAQTGPRHTIAFLATLARHTAIGIGCYCSDERICHRSRLRVLIQRAAAKNAL